MYSMQRELRWQKVLDWLPPSLNGFFTSNYGVASDQWSTVGLVAVDRGLTAMRHIPLSVSGMNWYADANSILVGGFYNDQLQYYRMKWEEAAPAPVRLPPEIMDSISPDWRWVLVHQSDNNGFSVAPFDTQLKLVEPSPWELPERSNPTVTRIFWSRDSKTAFLWLLRNMPEEQSSLSLGDHTEQVLVVYRFDDTAQSFIVEREYNFGNGLAPELAPAISPDGSAMVYLWQAERVLPSPEPLDYFDHYETRLLNLKTGETQLLSERPSVMQLWSSDSRYLLMSPFETKDTTLPDITTPNWRVFYHVSTPQLLPKTMQKFMAINGLNTPEDSENNPEKKIYVYDTLTGESQLIATREQFGEGYKIGWIPNSNIIHLKPRVDEYLAYGRPGGELKRLQYEGKDLLVSQSIDAVSGSTQTLGYYANDDRGMGTPFFYVNFETDVIAPIEFESHMYPGGSIGVLDEGSFLATARDNRLFGSGIPGGQSNSSLMPVYQVTSSGTKRIVEALTSNDGFYETTRLDHDRFAIERYEVIPMTYLFTSVRVWLLENPDQTVIPQSITISGSQLTHIYWRPRADD
jgi:hypothetical protein